MSHNQNSAFSVRYSAQYVLEHCAATGLAFTAGCDGKILSFAIDTAPDADAQSVVVTAKPVGALRRHTDFVQVSENKQPWRLVHLPFVLLLTNCENVR